MRDPRMKTVGKGLRRRGRLIAAALRPPGGAPGAGTGGGAGAAGTVPAVPDYGRTSQDYAAPRASRLVESPVFVLSPVRSGSTLLRVILNSHPDIRAPHEMHLRTLNVRMGRDFTPSAMRELELDKDELEHLLWDRVLHLELERSGKRVIVDKTPPNTLIWPRLRRCWPDARYLFLLRHPAAVVSSLVNRRREPDLEQIHSEVLEYAERLEDARTELNGHTVTYEHLTAEPEKATRDICRYLDVEWDAAMLDYGEQDHGSFRPHIGDWSSNIKSGRIQPARQPGDDVELPVRLAQIAGAWGYHSSPSGD
ncbi:sulfotransferase [Streptomyces armeniacus]|uniref:Sulfotransferase n=1 Tax=Streptomyces armeniacus TaxID=83291 RepID=A0A345XIF5_9ACTN|nr:sulfotransferase [Streptomyces armeniacus]AXK31421.1 sulfotransferase [Streptomyces armeniacus]